MPELKKLNLEALRPRPMAEEAEAEQQPAVAPVRQYSSTRRDWTKIGLICAVVCLAVYIAFDRGVIPTPVPQPDIDADGFYVLVIQPDSESDLDQGQKEFLKSAKVADWVNANGGEFRSYPQSQNLDEEEQVWKDIRAELSPPLVVGVVNDRRLTKLAAPSGIDAGIRELEKLK